MECGLDKMGLLFSPASVNRICITSRCNSTIHVCNRRNSSYMLKDNMHLLNVHYRHTGNTHDLRPFLVHEGTNDCSHSSLNLISSTARQAPGQ